MRGCLQVGSVKKFCIHFFFFFIYSCLCQALHVHETHTERYFTGLGCYFSYHGASFVLTLLPFLYFVAVIPFLY